MGWKNLKEHFRIDHFVQVTPAGICIGSPFIHDIIVIGPEGRLLKEDDRTLNGKIARYQAEIAADPEKVRQLIAAEDSFSASIPVYTYHRAEIIEKQCEEPGWPNVTHDGMMMFENTFSTDRNQVVAWAKRNARASIECREHELEHAEARVIHLMQRLSDHRADLATLNRSYPDIPVGE